MDQLSNMMGCLGKFFQKLCDTLTESHWNYQGIQIVQHVTVIDRITRIHFLDLLLRVLKFKEKFVDLHQMLHLVTDGFFDI